MPSFARRGHGAHTALREPERRVAFALHFERKRSLASVKACVEVVLGTRLRRDFPLLIRLADSIWKYEPARPSGRDPRLRDHYVAAETVERRKRLLSQGKPAGLPLRFSRFVHDDRRGGVRAQPDLARHRFLVLTLPEFERVFHRRACNPRARLFDIAYLLRDECGLLGVYPDLEYSGYQLLSSPFDEPECTNAERDANWHLITIGARDDQGNSLLPIDLDGRGILIGHPDTGWTAHDALNFTPPGPDPMPGQASPNFDPSTDHNVLRGEFLRASAREPVPNLALPLKQRYHGTRTAAVIISASSENDAVAGLAPGASIVSIRCVRSVVLISDLKVAQAVNAAVAAGAHVISISLGGFPAPPLRWAIQNAVWNDVLVVAAAGNYWPRVVFPAGYPECVAVGGCTIAGARWQYSSRNLFPGNRPIDIAAPARCVLHAAWNATSEPVSGRDHGTSFATALVAGAAALWLQKHGRQALIASLGGRAPLQALFQAHLAATASPGVGDWDVNLDGPGILNLPALLESSTMPIPSAFPVPAWATKGAIPVPASPLGIVGTGVALGPPGAAGSPPLWLLATFGDSAAEIVDRHAEELVQLLFTNPAAEAAANAAAAAAEAAAQAAQDAADAAADAVEEAREKAEQAATAAQNATDAFVDAVAGATSHGMSTVAGWL